MSIRNWIINKLLNIVHKTETRETIQNTQTPQHEKPRKRKRSRDKPIIFGKNPKIDGVIKDYGNGNYSFYLLHFIPPIVKHGNFERCKEYYDLWNENRHWTREECKNAFSKSTNICQNKTSGIYKRGKSYNLIALCEETNKKITYGTYSSKILAEAAQKYLTFKGFPYELSSIGITGGTKRLKRDELYFILKPIMSADKEYQQYLLENRGK